MAATITLSRMDLFPASKKVKVFEWQRNGTLTGPQVAELVKNNTTTLPFVGNPESWKPKPVKLAEPEVNSEGLLTLEGVQVGQEYLLWQTINSQGSYEATDGVLNATTTLTSATAGFTSIMVGQPVRGTGFAPGTKVAEYVSTTEVKLSIAAEVTASSVTFTVGEPNRYLTVRVPVSAKDGSIVIGSKKTVSVATTTTAVVAANSTREGIQITNSDATNIVYLQLGSGSAVLKEGIYLAPKGGTWDGLIGPAVWTGAVQGIAESGTCVVTVAEV